MVLKKSQIENLTGEELIEKQLQISDISCQLKSFNDRFDAFPTKQMELKSDLFITKSCNTLLHDQIIHLE